MNSTNTIVTLPQKLVNQLLQQAQNTSDVEVCGFIMSKNGRPTHIVPIENIAKSPETRFMMEPHAQINAMRIMREQGQTLFSIYHSHPKSPAHPSTTDIQEAGYPEALYLIISLNTEGVLEMAGFRIHDAQVTKVILEI